MILKTVLLPVPLGPMRPTSSSDPMAKSSALTAVRPPKRIVAFSSWRRGADIRLGHRRPRGHELVWRRPAFHDCGGEELSFYNRPHTEPRAMRQRELQGRVRFGPGRSF